MNIFDFFFNSKEGPGVEKPENKNYTLKLFFQIYGRKIWKLLTLNIIYVLINLPAIFVAAVILPQFYMSIFSGTTFLDELAKNQGNVLFIALFIGLFFVVAQLVVIGPATAGFTYILRNFARESSVFLWSDFKKAAFSNFKQSAIISLLDFVIVLFIGIDISIYVSSVKNGGMLTIILAAVLILAGLIYLMMHIYIYQIMITFESSIKNILKNSLMFALIKFVPNLLILIVCASVLIMTFGFFPQLGIALYCVITVSTIGFIVNYFANKQLIKYTQNRTDQNNIME